jgi:hypothetical protein
MLQLREYQPELPPHDNPRDLIFQKHQERNDSSVPDRHHSDEFVKEMTLATDRIRTLMVDIQDLLEKIQGNAEWITDGQRDGYPGKFFTHEEIETVNTAISDLDLHHYITAFQAPVLKKKTTNVRFQNPVFTHPVTRSMTNASRYNRRQNCIHCNSRRHESADHHTATTVPPMHPLPARPTQRRQNPTPGPSTPARPTQVTTTPRRRRLTRNEKKEEERKRFLEKKRKHSPNVCNHCINGRQCDIADDNARGAFDAHDYFDYDEVTEHNMDD